MSKPQTVDLASHAAAELFIVQRRSLFGGWTTNNSTAAVWPLC